MTLIVLNRCMCCWISFQLQWLHFDRGCMRLIPTCGNSFYWEFVFSWSKSKLPGHIWAWLWITGTSLSLSALTMKSSCCLLLTCSLCCVEYWCICCYVLKYFPPLAAIGLKIGGTPHQRVKQLFLTKDSTRFKNN